MTGRGPKSKRPNLAPNQPSTPESTASSIDSARIETKGTGLKRSCREQWAQQAGTNVMHFDFRATHGFGPEISSRITCPTLRERNVVRSQVKFLSCRPTPVMRSRRQTTFTDVFTFMNV
jgi:hypothetical protein